MSSIHDFNSCKESFDKPAQHCRVFVFTQVLHISHIDTGAVEILTLYTMLFKMYPKMCVLWP